VSPRLFLLRVIEPGLALLPTYMVCNQARVLLMTIAGQESNWAARQQESGPALGYWQFEREGVNAVVLGQSVHVQAALATMDLDVAQIMAAIQYNDPIACVIARLLLWSDPAPLPAIGNSDDGWRYYTRLWRPGRPDGTRWPPAYAMAVSTVASG